MTSGNRRVYLRARRFLPSLVAAGTVILGMRAHADTFYISPTGDDNDSGNSPNAPWKSLAKVNSTVFSPGSQILFQAGGNWYGNLGATSDGAIGNPITYGSYGSGPNPTFWGSDVLNPGGFHPISGNPGSYTYTVSSTLNAFYLDHQFFRNATTITGTANRTTDVAYVESNPGTYYAFGATVYVNTGSASAPSTGDGHTYTGGFRDSVVENLGHSNLVFQDLTVRESAKVFAGYAFDMQQGSNVSVLNSTAIATGKHAFSAIDIKNFLGQGLQASYAMPDQLYGGASAFVTYTSVNFSGTSSQWINDTFSNPNGPYQAFITHEDQVGGINSVLVQNMRSTGEPAMSIYSAAGDANERIKIVGGRLNNGDIQVFANNVVIDGILMTGTTAAIELNGDNNTVQNSIISGAAPDSGGGRDGAIVLNGQHNIVRYNTIDISAAAKSNAIYGAAVIGLIKGNPNLPDNAQDYGQVYGNVFTTARGAIWQNFTGVPTLQFADNLFSGTATPIAFYANLAAPDLSLSIWLAELSSDSIVGNPSLVNSAGAEYWLLPSGQGFSAIPLDSSLGQTILSEINANGYTNVTFQTVSAVPEPASLGLLAAGGLFLARRPRRRANP